MRLRHTLHADILLFTPQYSVSETSAEVSTPCIVEKNSAKNGKILHGNSISARIQRNSYKKPMRVFSLGGQKVTANRSNTQK